MADLIPSGTCSACRCGEGRSQDCRSWCFVRESRNCMVSKFLKAVLALMAVEDQCIGQTIAGLPSEPGVHAFVAPRFRELIDLLE